MTARHPFSENTLQHRNHRPPHETHSAQAVETPFEKTQEDKMTSAALRSIGTRASCHRRNRRGFRFRETEYEMRASREPDSGSVGGFTILRRFLFWKFGRPLVPDFPATARPGSGKVPANTRRHRLREASGPRTRTVFGSETKTRPAAKTVVHTVPSFGGAGARCISIASQNCRCNGRNIAETSLSTSETRSFFFRFQALCRQLRIISTSVRISRPAPGRPSPLHRPARPMIMSDKTRRKTRRGKIRDRSA